MNYLNEKQEVCENDIILTHKYKGAKEHLAIVNSIDAFLQVIQHPLQQIIL